MKTQLRAKFRDADLDCLSTSIVEDLLQVAKKSNGRVPQTGKPSTIS